MFAHRLASFRVVATLIVISLLMAGCIITVTPDSATLPTDGSGVLLTATEEEDDDLPLPTTVQLSLGQGSDGDALPCLTCVWYLDGVEIPNSVGETYLATEPGVYEAKRLVTVPGGVETCTSNPAVILAPPTPTDLPATATPLPSATPEATPEDTPTSAPTSVPTSVPPATATAAPPTCRRAEVSVVIYGGWDGIPVRAWVGGTEQETLYTARDASGEAAVLWTFYPPEDAAWTVRVAADLPAGVDSAAWEYRLLRIETGSGVVDDPLAATVSIRRCSETVVYLQLVHRGAGE